MYELIHKNDNQYSRCIDGIYSCVKEFWLKTTSPSVVSILINSFTCFFLSATTYLAFIAISLLGKTFIKTALLGAVLVILI